MFDVIIRKKGGELMDAIVVACITGGLSLIGVIFTNIMSNANMEHKLDKAQAVTATKLDNLTLEVRKHNNFAEKIPAIEERLRILEQEVRT